MTTPFICTRCHYVTHKLDTILDHLRKKTPCLCEFSDDDRETIITSLQEQVYPCPHCTRVFIRAKCLARHGMQCMGALRNSIDQLVVKIDNLEEKNNANVVINNIQTNTFNITINNFGSEDRSYITKEIMQQCLDKMKISLLVESIYFHPDHPENHTIKLKSEKKKRVSLVRDGKWVEGDMSASIDSIVHRENTSLSNFFYENIWPDQSIDFNNKAWTHKKLITINDKNKEFFEQRREIQAKLKNGASDS